MGFGLQNFVKDIEAREDGKPVAKDISVKKDAPAFPTAAKKPSGPMDRIQSVMPDLYKIEKDPKHALGLSGDTLKTLCELGVIDISINEKGKKLTESFRIIEQVTGKLPKEPVAEETGDAKNLAQKVSAIPEKGADNDDDIICTKRPAEKKPQKSIYLIETPREKKPAEPPKASALIPPPADAPRTEAQAPGAPLIPPRAEDQQK